MGAFKNLHQNLNYCSNYFMGIIDPNIYTTEYGVTIYICEYVSSSKTKFHLLTSHRRIYGI